MGSVFADKALAVRLESFAAEEMRRFVVAAHAYDPACGADALEVAGGVAVYLGPGSPVNQAVGLGLTEKFTDADASLVERFFSSRGQRGLAAVSPFVDHSLIVTLGKRGWQVDGFENVLVTELSQDAALRMPTDDGIEIVVADEDEAKAVWAEVVAVGFSAPLEPPPMQRELSRVIIRREGSVLLLALVDGMPAGTGEVFMDDGIAWLSADTTLPLYRRRGVQQALQTARLRLAAEAGCELAVTEAQPGSGSQRNMERAGFRVAYTRVDLVSPEPDEAGRVADER